MNQMGKDEDQLQCIIDFTSNNKNSFKACYKQEKINVKSD